MFVFCCSTTVLKIQILELLFHKFILKFNFWYLTSDSNRALQFAIRNDIILIHVATYSYIVPFFIKVYVYSMWTHGLSTLTGVVSASPMDWDHSQVLPVLRSVVDI